MSFLVEEFLRYPAPLVPGSSSLLLTRSCDSSASGLKPCSGVLSSLSAVPSSSELDVMLGDSNTPQLRAACTVAAP